MSAAPVPEPTIAVDGRTFIEAGIRGRPLRGASHMLAHALRRRLGGRVVIMGIGNPMLGDDAVGCVVARQLHQTLAPMPGLTIIEAEEIPESYVGVVESARPGTVLLIDAADLAAEPGSLVLVNAERLADHAAFTHRTPLAPLAIYLEKRTRSTVLFVGIQPGPMEWGDGLSPDVAATADQLVMILMDALRPAPAEPPHVVAEPPVAEEITGAPVC